MKLHSLPQWLSYLERLHPKAIDMGLERVCAVMQRMGLSRPAKQVVTVTGTNGKGSTCAILASLLEQAGRKVGLYTSPHLLRYNERVRIQGVEATDEALCEAFAAVEAARGDVSLTYFEMGTLAAFWLFERAGLDVAVLEVGLGGRLDAVNAVDADVAVITSIDLDHGEWLGDTRDSVAQEKAGIIRPGRPVVCGELNPPAVVIEKARELSAPLYLNSRDYALAMGEQSWHWQGETLHRDVVALHDLPMIDLPLINAATALQAYALLGLPLDGDALVQGLRQTRVIGRWDRRVLSIDGRRLHFLLDVAHNPHAAHYLADYLRTQPVTGRRLAVFSLLADKDLPGVVEPMIDLIDDWAIAPLATPRARAVDEIETELSHHRARVQRHADIESALKAQCDEAREEDEIIVFGSFYCVAEALNWLESTGCAEEN